MVERKELKPERVGLDAVAVVAAAELGVEPIGLGELPSGQLPELVEEGDVVLVVGLDAGEGQVVPAVVPATVTEDRGVGRAVGEVVLPVLGEQRRQGGGRSSLGGRAGSGQERGHEEERPGPVGHGSSPLLPRGIA